MGIIQLFTMPDDAFPVQSAAARDINSGQAPAAERRARLTVFDGIPLPTKADGKIHGLPMKSPRITPAAPLTRTTAGLTVAGAHEPAPLGEGGAAPMNLSITTAQAVQTGLPCAF